MKYHISCELLLQCNIYHPDNCSGMKSPKYASKYKFQKFNIKFNSNRITEPDKINSINNLKESTRQRMCL